MRSFAQSSGSPAENGARFLSGLRPLRNDIGRDVRSPRQQFAQHPLPSLRGGLSVHVKTLKSPARGPWRRRLSDGRLRDVRQPDSVRCAPSLAHVWEREGAGGWVRARRGDAAMRLWRVDCQSAVPKSVDKYCCGARLADPRVGPHPQPPSRSLEKPHCKRFVTEKSL